MSPVDAHATALMLRPSAIICLTTETSTVIPRSLNDPVCELPHIFTQRSSIPIARPYRSAQKMFVPPSSIETTFSSRISGQIHSFLPQTPEPYGHAVRLYRSSKRRIQATGLRCRNASMSCETCNS